MSDQRRDLPVTRKTQRESARELVLADLRREYEHVARIARTASGYCSTYVRERRRLTRIALRAVERAS